MFTEAEEYWDLERLSVDLAGAKAHFKGVSQATLSDREYKYLKGILCNKGPRDISDVYQVGRSTVSSCLSEFIYRYIEILAEKQIQETVQISDWHDVPLILEQLGYKRCLLSNTQQVAETVAAQSSWEGAPNVSEFFGRDALLNQIVESITKKERRIILLVGANGIGKTTLAVKVAQVLETEHQYSVFWRSLTDAPLLDQLLDQIQRLWGSQDLSSAVTIEDGLRQLMLSLQHSHRLVVLDAVESLLEERTYQQPYKNYMDFFRQICEIANPSCVLLTSAESVRNIEVLRSKGFAVEIINVQGLDKQSIQQVLQGYGVDCDDLPGCDRIHRIYGGNPQFTKITAWRIQNLCGGKLSEFTALDTILIDEQMQDTLIKAWQSLSDNEHLVMTRLYRNCQPTSVCDLKTQLNGEIKGSPILNALNHLKYRALIEAFAGTPVTYQLVPVVRRFLSDHLDI